VNRVEIGTLKGQKYVVLILGLAKESPIVLLEMELPTDGVAANIKRKERHR
jgi:hypothetical protein